MPWSSGSCATESGLPPTTTNSHIQSYPMCLSKKTKFEDKNFIAGKTSPPRPVNGKCLSLALPRSILMLDG